MKPAQRFALLGTYRTPRFRYGATVYDESRGDVIITGMSDGPIPWPIGRPPGSRQGRPSLILFRSLVRAVKKESNQAIAHHWGVSGQVVTRWRKALEVKPNTKGTRKLRVAYSHEPPAVRARRKAHAKSRDPKRDAGRRAKIAASKVGKKRPAHVLTALLKANVGNKHKKATRQKMSASHRKRGTRPPWLNPSWSDKEDALLRKLPVAEAAKQTGRSVTAVYMRRNVLGVEDGRRSAGQ